METEAPGSGKAEAVPATKEAASSRLVGEPLPVSGYQSRLATSKWLAWLYLGCILASFHIMSWLLQISVPTDPGMYAELYEKVPSALFQWQLAAFGGVTVINILNILFCTSQVQYNCNVLLIAIHSVAFTTDLALVRRVTPLLRTGAGPGGFLGGASLFFPLRYVQWLHSTPTMLLLMALMSDIGSTQLMQAIAADVIMILTGLAASWVNGPMQLVAAVISFLAFIPVMACMTAMMQGAIQEARDPQAQQRLRLMLGTTLFVWALFPAVWVTAHLGLLSPATEHLLWGISDYMAKVVFSSHLWQKNFVTIEQRKADAQRALEEANRGLILERLRELLMVKDRLVHSLTHELRTPINGIVALVNELLHNSAQSTAGRAKMLAMIRSSAGCLLNIINATLDAAAVSSGTLKLTTYKVNLWRVTECVVRLTRPLLKDNVQLINCVDLDFPPVRTDSTRLMQVLFNLVGNASRFTHAGSVRISAVATPDGAMVSVTDTGAGIAPERLSTIFQPFEKGSQSAGTTGLGLYLVKQCLDAMGCQISVNSKLGQGTTFTFQLPIADEDAESEESVGIDTLGAAIAATSCRSSMESPNWGGSAGAAGGGSGAAGRGRRGSFELARLAAAVRRRLSGSRTGSLDADSAAAAIAADPRTNGGGASSTASQQEHTEGGGSGSSPTVRRHQQQLQGPAAVPAVNPSGTARAVGSDPASGSAAGAGGAVGVVAEGAAATLRAPRSSGAAGEGSPIGSGGSGGITGAPGLPLKPNHRTKHGSIQVLSVDDDAINQMVAATVLKSHKWGVIKCMNGMEALDHLSRCAVLPDLVLLDVMMPRMSGYDVARRIREMYPSNALPIIMVSAKAEEEDIVEGLKCGADDYVSKPFKRAELAARIRAHIRARDAFAEQQAADQQWMLQHNLLPRNVQRKLRNGETVVAEHHTAATVLWAEVVGLPRLAAEVPPLELVVMLNSLYTTWDELCEEEGALGVDFSGSTYVAVSGHDDNPQHLELVLKVAEGMLGVAAATRYPDGSAVQIRLGVHTGPINTGLVGSKAVKFTLLGETVDVARQLAATGCPMAVHVSDEVHDRLKGTLPPGSCMPWTLQRLRYAAAANGGAAAAGIAAATATSTPSGNGAAPATATGQPPPPPPPGRPQQTYLLPSKYAPPAAAGGSPVVSVALDTPEAFDGRPNGSQGGSGMMAGAAAAAAAAAVACRRSSSGQGWGGGRRRSGMMPQDVPWLQLHDMPGSGITSPPPSADIALLASELSAARTTHLEAQIAALSRQADAAIARERELQERLLALTADHAKASAELTLSQERLQSVSAAAAAERRRADALQAQAEGGAALRQQLGEVWRTMAAIKREMAVLLAEQQQQQQQQGQQVSGSTGRSGGTLGVFKMLSPSSSKGKQQGAAAAASSSDSSRGGQGSAAVGAAPAPVPAPAPAAVTPTPSQQQQPR